MGSSPSTHRNQNMTNSNHGNSSSQSSSRSHQIITKCAQCNSRVIFGIRQCTRCNREYCVECWDQQHSSQPSESRAQYLSCCRTCATLYGPLKNFNELMLLKAVELREFLEKNGISTAQCSGKEELVDLVLERFPQQSLPSSHGTSHKEDVQRMAERLRNDFGSSSTNETSVGVRESSGSRRHILSNESITAPKTTSTGGTSKPAPQLSNPKPAPRNIPVTNDIPSARMSTNVASSSRTALTTATTTSSAATASPSISSLPTETRAYPHSSTMTPSGAGAKVSCPHERSGAPCKWRSMPSEQRVLLEEVVDEETLSCLSSRHLKDILAFNFVNYRDCLERSELVERAVWLWRNKQRAKSREAQGQGTSSKAPAGSGTGTAGGGQLCAICMDAEADAVFLDCGHLVACTECGRRLAECPICRRNIIRVVKVFKS